MTVGRNAVELQVVAAPKRDEAFCWRCDGNVPVDRPWRGWRWFLRGWMGLVGGLLLLFPFLSADYCVMIPSFMVILSAIGPLRGFAAQRPSCKRCRLELE